MTCLFSSVYLVNVCVSQRILQVKCVEATSPEAKSVRYCDVHRRKLGVLAIFTESSEISSKCFLRRKAIFSNKIKIHKYLVE